MTPAPDDLRFHFELFRYRSYSVRLVGDSLEYRASSSSQQEKSFQNIIPSEEEWNAFTQALDDLRVWEWLPSYYAPVLDGAGWDLAVQVGDRRVESEGSNAYPGDEPGTSAEVEMSRRFEEFCTALSILLGGVSFNPFEFE